MKYKLKYSPDASDKLREIKKQIAATYGNQVATKILSKITSDIRGLQEKPGIVLISGESRCVKNI